MIAFNELLANLEEYEENYKRRGYNISLSNFVILEDKRKIVQLKAESLRAQTNKLCASVAVLKRQNKDISDIINQINQNEKTLKKLNSKLNRMGKKIDGKLKNLPNLTELDNIYCVQLKTTKNQSTLENLNDFINSNFNQINSNLSVHKFVKSLTGRMFQESELGLAAHCKNGIVLLFQNYNAEEIKTWLLDYLKNNSLNLTKVSVKNLKKSSSAEYLAVINNTKTLKVEIKGEYFTRANKIKYRNLKIDATKFVYEIDILYKEK